MFALFHLPRGFLLGKQLNRMPLHLDWFSHRIKLALSENLLSTNIIAYPVTHKFNGPCLSTSSYAAFHTG